MNENLRPADAQLPRPGDVVAGKYRIESIIGAGGMGVVLGATDTSLGRPVAIKFLAPARVGREGAVARFLREARAAAAIQSEHVVRVYEVGTMPNGAPYIVMEHLRGSDLSQILTSRGVFQIHEVADYLLQACEALGEAHTRGIVHRDLKPQNLFLTQMPDGTPCIKVLDFGISKAADDESQNLTSTDMVMGTPLYMSPEQVRSLKNVDARSDIWALGSIMFELLTGTPIFEAPSASALCAMIAMDPPIPLRARRPASPPELEALILRCLHKDPAGRFQDVAALATALAPFATERGRASVTRIARVVRPASSPIVSAGPNPMTPYTPSPNLYSGSGGSGAGTVDGHGRTSYAPNTPHMQGPPGAPPPPLAIVPSVSNLPPRPNTQETWGHTQGQAGTPPPRGSNSALVAVLGVLTGLVLLAVLFGAGYYMLVVREAAKTAQTEANRDAGGAAGAMTSPASNTVPSPPASIPPMPPTASTGAPSAQPTAPKTLKDAGAPSAQKDAGAKPNKEDEERESLKRIAESRCGHMRMMLSQNDAKTNSNAKMVRDQTCLRASSLSTNSGAANCDRTVCRSACSMLQDQDCIRRLDYAERSNPLKY